MSDNLEFGYDPGNHPDYWTDAYVDYLAEAKGCTVERADDKTLQLDIDSDEGFQTFLAQFDLLTSTRGAPAINYDVRPSKSGGTHVHIRVFLSEPLDVFERIALQAALGSDRKRELLNFKGAQMGMEFPIVLFRPRA